jgi:hypothetical protein
MEETKWDLSRAFMRGEVCQGKLGVEFASQELNE